MSAVDDIVRANLTAMDHPSLVEHAIVLEKLITERDRLLDAVPRCPEHGPGCVPHAIEWVARKRDDYAAALVGCVGDNPGPRSVPWTTYETASPLADFAALEEHREEEFRRFLRSRNCSRCGSPHERDASLFIFDDKELPFCSEMCRTSFVRIVRGWIRLHPKEVTPLMRKWASLEIGAGEPGPPPGPQENTE